MKRQWKDQFLASVVARHGRPLMKFFVSRLPNAADAPDLVQEVYLRLLRLDRPDLIRCPEAYLFTNDKGRFAVTKTATDEYVFKVPTLRNIALTAPYFHTGRSWDLRQAVAVTGARQLGTELTSQEIGNVMAFLQGLTGEQPKIEYPILPPSVAAAPRPQP